MKNPRVAEALLPLKKDLELERDAIVAAAAPHHARRQNLVSRIQALESELAIENEAISAIEQPRLRDIGNELAAIARQLGPVITVQNEGVTP